jgi:hypothetical protein
MTPFFGQVRTTTMSSSMHRSDKVRMRGPINSAELTIIDQFKVE